MYAAQYLRPRYDPRIEVCTLTHAGPLPAPWLAAGFVVNLVLDGEADLRSRGAVHRVGPGHVVLANPGELRAVTRRYTTTATTRSITLDEQRIHDAIRARGTSLRPAHFDRPTTTSDSLRRALVVLWGATSAVVPRLTLEIAVESLLDQICRVVNVVERERWPAHPAVRRARAYIEDHLGDDVGLMELVAVTGLSRAHLIREFRRQVGLPPHQYQLHARVRRGKELLARGSTVAAVASATGFFDQAHFARHFRRLVGVSARDYQRAVTA